MWKYEGNMKKYVEICEKYARNRRQYDEEKRIRPFYFFFLAMRKYEKI